MITDKKPDYEYSATAIVVEDEEEEQQEEKEEALEQSREKVPVYVCGEVVNPDVYYLDETMIVKEAIELAGGFTENANKQIWNLAMTIQKGMKIEVPEVGKQIDKSRDSYDNSIRDIEVLDSQYININEASMQELTKLSGIGPVVAQNIIDFREANGQFKSLEDIKNVPRIGQVTLEKIKDHICFQ